MTKDIIDGLDLAGNGKNENGTTGTTGDDSGYMDYRRARAMVNKFLACDREILMPTIVAGYTIVELARELRVTPENIRELRMMSAAYWRRVRSRVNLKLITLFLNTKFYEK